MLVSFFLLGCDRPDSNKENGSPTDEIKKHSEKHTLGPNDLEVDPKFLMPDLTLEEVKYELKPAAVREAFRKVMYVSIPDYIVNVRGVGSFDGEPETAYEWGLRWGGVVPPEHIEDFKTFLATTGIDYRQWRRENIPEGLEGWEDEPEPAPGTLFRFASQVLSEKAGKRSRWGLEFNPGSAVQWGYQTSDIKHLGITIQFDQENGHVLFMGSIQRD